MCENSPWLQLLAPRYGRNECSLTIFFLQDTKLWPAHLPGMDSALTKWDHALPSRHQANKQTNKHLAAIKLKLKGQWDRWISANKNRNGLKVTRWGASGLTCSLVTIKWRNRRTEMDGWGQNWKTEHYTTAAPKSILADSYPSLLLLILEQ